MSCFRKLNACLSCVPPCLMEKTNGTVSCVFKLPFCFVPYFYNLNLYQIFTVVNFTSNVNFAVPVKFQFQPQ